MDSVIKRDGLAEAFSFDKILNRVLRLGDDNDGDILNINYTSLVQKIIDRLYDGIPTTLIDELTAQQCASLITTHPDYGILASRLLISNHQKNTNPIYSEVIQELYDFEDVHSVKSPLISDELYTIVTDNANEIQGMIDYDRDFHLDYFGFKTLERAYLQRIDKRIVERPQHMWMRVAIAVHGNDMKNVKLSYDLMSQKFFTHATPTLFNAGTPRQQLSSCYLLAMEDDSIEGIYSTLTDCAKISKWAGGIGLHIHNVRATGSHIRGTNGTSNGIVPMLRVFNDTARYVDQGGGKRKGSFAIYMEPWHSDIKSFLDMKKNHGDEEQRARDLFYALWIPDLFMHRVKNGMKWTLMCPDKCPGLSDVYGGEFVSLYEKYEGEGRGISCEARDIWFKIGYPYILFRDNANNGTVDVYKDNKHEIYASNLCTEIMLPSNEDWSFVCCLSSINLVHPLLKNTTTSRYIPNPIAYIVRWL